MADELPGVAAIQSGAETIKTDFQSPRKHLWLLLIIGGGLVALALLIKHSAQKVTPASTSTPPSTPPNETFNLSETLVQSPPTTTTTTTAPPVITPPAPVKLPPPGPPVSTGHHLTYIVEPGDTIDGIAAKFGITPTQIDTAPGNRATVIAAAHAHGITSNEWQHIYPGEMIYIPLPYGQGRTRLCGLRRSMRPTSTPGMAPSTSRMRPPTRIGCSITRVAAALSRLHPRSSTARQMSRMRRRSRN